MLEEKLNFVGKWVALSAIALLLVASVYFPRNLLADGPFYLSNMLAMKTFVIIEPSRTFAQYLSQAPTVLAIWAGVTSLNTLVRLHSIGLVAIPLAMWGYALYLHLKSGLFWLFVGAFSVSYLVSCFAVIGEHNMAFAATALSAALLLKVEKIRLLDGLLLVALAVLLIRTYESALFLNALLFFIAILRMRSRESMWTTFLLIVCCVAYLAGVIIAATWIINPRDPANFKGAVDFRWVLGNHQLQYVAWSSVSIVSLLFIRSRRFQIAIMLSFVLFSLYFLVHTSAWNAVVDYTRARALAGLALFSSLALIAVLRFMGLKPTRPSDAVCAAMFAVLLVPFGIALDRFQKFSRCYEKNVERLTGVVELERSGVTSCYAFRDFDAAWTNTSLSILYRGPSSSAVLMNAKDWTYFNPVNPYSVPPDLLRSYPKTRTIF